MYLMMLYYYRRPAEVESGSRRRIDPSRPVWFSTNGFRNSHGLSEDTRLTGIRSLQEAGIIEISQVSIDSSGGASGHRRFRRQLLTLPPPRSNPHFRAQHHTQIIRFGSDVKGRLVVVLTAATRKRRDDVKCQRPEQRSEGLRSDVVNA